jgi:hypothetical protein
MPRSPIRAKAARRAARRLVLLALVLASFHGRVLAQSSPDGVPPPAPPAATASAGPIPIDGVAARIEDDVITESEVRELAAFQTLVDGQAKPRAELIRELADQWIIRSEATATKFQRPTQETLDHAFADFVKQFPSPDEFKQRCRSVGLSEAAVRRMLEEQLYLSRFIEYRFRPAAQVDDKQIEAYYRDEFSPQLKQRGEPVPPLEDVEETIHEVLVQRIITERSAQWLDDSREHLKIDIVPQDGSQ